MYGTTAVGGLVTNVVENDDEEDVVVTYVICDKKDGFDYTIRDIQFNGEWLRTVSQPLNDGRKEFGKNDGENGEFGDNVRMNVMPSGGDYSEILQMFHQVGYTSQAANEACGIMEEDIKGEGLVWCTLHFKLDDTAREFWRTNGIRPESARFRVQAVPTETAFPLSGQCNPVETLKLHLKNEMSVPDSRIDSASFTEGARICEDRSYWSNGFFRSGEEYQATQWLLQACGGSLVEEGGMLYCKGFNLPEPVATITEDMLIRPPEIEHTVPWDQKYNHIRGEILDAGENYTRQSTPEFKHESGFLEDGNKMLLDVGALRMVNTQRQAQSLLVRELAQRRVSERITVQIHSSDAPDIKAFDTVIVDFETNGILRTQFRVAGVAHSIEGLMGLTLVSESGVQTTVDGTALAPAITDLSAASRSSTGCVLSWSATLAEQVTTMEYRFREQGGDWGDWETLPRRGAPSYATLTTSQIRGILTAGTTYDFVVRCKAGATIGADSNIATVTTQAGLGQVTGLTATAGIRSVTLRWNRVEGAAHYWMQYRTGSTWVTRSWIARQPESGQNQLAWTWRHRTAGTTIYFRLLAEDSDDNFGPVSDVVSATPLATPPPQPTDRPLGAPRSFSAFRESHRGNIIFSLYPPSGASSVNILRYEYRYSTDRSAWTSWATVLAWNTGTGYVVTYDFRTPAYTPNDPFVSFQTSTDRDPHPRYWQFRVVTSAGPGDASAIITPRRL